MTVKELLIKFQEYQLEYKVLNANCAHNAAANLFMERYGVKNCSIPDVIKSVCEHDFRQMFINRPRFCKKCGEYETE